MTDFHFDEYLPLHQVFIEVFIVMSTFVLLQLRFFYFLIVNFSSFFFFINSVQLILMASMTEIFMLVISSRNPDEESTPLHRTA